MRNYTAALVAAGAIGLAFAVLPAKGQGFDQTYDQSDNYQGTNVGGPNEVVVVGPSFHVQTSPLNTPPENVSITERVNYADLDLRTPYGARELRRRVRLAAARICGQLREIYPYAITPRVPCVRSALNNSMLKADSAIVDERIAARRANENGYYGGYER